MYLLFSALPLLLPTASEVVLGSLPHLHHHLLLPLQSILQQLAQVLVLLISHLHMALES